MRDIIGEKLASLGFALPEGSTPPSESLVKEFEDRFGVTLPPTFARSSFGMAEPAELRSAPCWNQLRSAPIAASIVFSVLKMMRLAIPPRSLKERPISLRSAMNRGEKCGGSFVPSPTWDMSSCTTTRGARHGRTTNFFSGSQIWRRRSRIISTFDATKNCPASPSGLNTSTLPPAASANSWTACARTPRRCKFPSTGNGQIHTPGALQGHRVAWNGNVASLVLNSCQTVCPIFSGVIVMSGPMDPRSRENADA